MKDKKEIILKLLKKEGRMSTNRISSLIKSSFPRALELLVELEKEKKVKKIEETMSTYWELK